MAILSHCHHSLKSCSNSEVVQASLGLLLTLSKSQQGCQGLLAVDLSQVKTDLEFTSQGHLKGFHRTGARVFKVG